jgi:pilus assembly protein CpaB
VSLRTFLVVALALVCGGAAAVGLGSIIRNQKAQAAAPAVPTAQVVFAAGDISRLASLSTEHLVVREVPKDSVPKGAITRVEDAIGRVALIPVSRNDYILDQQLAKPGAGRGAAAAIPKGMRAFMIPTNKLAGAACGFLQPGDKVDVLLSIKPKSNQPSDEPITRTLLSRIEVFAVDQTLEPPSSPDSKIINVKELRSVTLLVTPAEATQLSAGVTEGVLQLTLRNADDEHVAPPPAPVVKEKPAPAPEPATNPVRQAIAEATQGPPAPSVIRTLRGAQEGEVRLANVPAKQP